LFVRKSDDKLVGMLQVRHCFNDYLKQYGGHIGYSVRPSERRRGVAKEMLHAALPFCREAGLERLLITCIEGNTGSEKTILANGGIYESTVLEPNENVLLKRFWITL
ncbi:MAG: GNAT family N-acetyltransferase, partial [Oscillospiraceae bacterium]|nr:GNAT family N-acetyltransferase [Oscillospiraceae bacterium]